MIQYITYAIYGLVGIFVILFFFSIFKMTKRNTDTKKMAFSDKTLYRMKQSRFEYFTPESIEKRITALGAPYIFKNKLTTLSYIMIKFVFAFLGLILGTILGNLLIGILTGGLFFFALDFVLKLNNDDDNKRMMEDIQVFFSVIRTQTLAGISITTSLSESYNIVKNKRLKAELIELSSKILAHKPLDEAMDEFNSKFKNPYIESFCIVVKQAQDNGQASKLLGDLSNQITNIQNSLQIKKQNREENINTFLNLLIFAGFLMTCMMYLFLSTDFSSIF